MEESTTCPLINKKVHITRKGWNHLLERRRLKDKQRRLKLLKDAKYIIKNADTIRRTKRNGTEYIELREKTRNHIKVILKTDQKGNVSFFSVM